MPLTDSVKFPAPAIAEDGFNAAIDGGGAGGAPTVNVIGTSMNCGHASIAWKTRVA